MSETVFQNGLDNLTKFNQNIKWFQDNYDALKQKYGGEYVAIYNSELVGHHTDSQELIRSLRDVYDDLTTFVIEQVHKQPSAYIV
jgi:hypothetical protein